MPDHRRIAKALLALCCLAGCNAEREAPSEATADAEDTTAAEPHDAAEDVDTEQDAADPAVDDAADDVGSHDASDVPGPLDSGDDAAGADDSGSDVNADVDAAPDVAVDATPTDAERACDGGQAPNPCGGCVDLSGLVGQACGCDAGLWHCDGADAIACLDAEGQRLYRDMDGDGWGVEGPLPTGARCTGWPTASPALGDCDDDAMSVYPGSSQTWCGDDFAEVRRCDGPDSVAAFRCVEGHCSPYYTPWGCDEDCAPGRATTCIHYNGAWTIIGCNDDGSWGDELEQCGPEQTCADGTCR